MDGATDKNVLHKTTLRNKNHYINQHVHRQTWLSDKCCIIIIIIINQLHVNAA